MRKLLIFGLALSVVGSGLMPLSACALICSKTAECAQATAESPCDQMDNDSAGIQLSKDSDKSCCVNSQVPLPELQFKVAAAEAGPAVSIAVPQDVFALLSVSPYNTQPAVENASPPSFQSLLCTFLI